MPIKLRGRTKYKSAEDTGQAECNHHSDFVKPQKSKMLLWRLFSSSRRSVDNISPASQSVESSSYTFEGNAILEEEYQESFDMTLEHSESVPSMRRKITPPRLSDPPPGGGGVTTTRHSVYATSRDHRYAPATGESTTAAAAAAAIYNEPCDARRVNGNGSTLASNKSALRRASLAASIYCDTEHHRQDTFQLLSSPQGSPDSLQPNASNDLWEASNSSGLTTKNGRKNGIGNHGPHDSRSSSLSNSRDPSSLNNPHFEMASPPIGSIPSTSHSPLTRPRGSMRIDSRSPPPPSTTQPQLLARDHRHRQQQVSLAHTSSSSSTGPEHGRNLSPRQPAIAATVAAVSSSHSVSPALSNSPMLRGNTQISHHPSSPFAPIARITPCTSRASLSTAAVATTATPSSRNNSDVTAPTAYPCAQSHHLPATPPPPPPPPPDCQRVLCNSCASVSNGPSARQILDEGQTDVVRPTSGGPRAPQRRKDLAATYEEAWDVKMSRRLGGMDVSRLAEALPNGNFKRCDLIRASDRPLRSPAAAATVVRSPSLSPVLTSTEGITMRQPRPRPRISFRNSSTDTVINREMRVSPFGLKQNRIASPTVTSSISPSPSEVPATYYDYAYNRSWSMGVQLNLSLNLAGNAESSADQTMGPMGVEVGNKPESPISAASSPPPPPPHRSASIMTPSKTQFSPSQSPAPTRRLRLLPHTTTTVSDEVSPPSSRVRGVHNPLATGVPNPLTSSSPPSEESTMRWDTCGTGSVTNNTTGAAASLLPHMSRLLTDWDNMSTDSSDEPWNVRQGKAISQLTSSRFIDPSEVLSAVAGGNYNGTITDISSGGVSNGRGAAGAATEVEGGAPIPPSLGISPPTSCPSPLARSPSDVPPVQNCLKSLNEQPWFHPNLTRIAAEKRLRSEPEGSFLVRNSETIKDEYSLTVKHNGFLHMRITRDEQGQFVLGEYSQPYPSIPHMISHYEQSQVPVKGADSVTLCHPR